MPEPAITAALGPAHDRKPAHALLFQPGPHFPGSEGDVGLGPLPRPEVFGPIKTGRAHPVAHGEVVRILDPEAALLGRVDHEQPA